jgi:hypothetical protein
MFDTSGSRHYYRDHDDDNLIVRVWYEDGKRRGEYFGFKSKTWREADELAWMVADEIYENHPLSEADVEKITGVKIKD